MDLDELVQEVEERAISAEPLDLVAAAMSTKADLDDLGDGLIDVFVGRARAAGFSWSEIGSAMGVTKQAAQQRHSSGRPKRDRPLRTGRFTGRAKMVMREAQSAAIELGHAYIGTEHLLLGILAVPRCLAAEALRAAGFEEGRVLAAVEGSDERSRQRRRRHLPFTPRANEAVKGALDNAVRLGHNYIGTEHLLLSLFDQPEGVAAKVLTEAGLTKAAIEAFCVERLSKAS